MTDDGHYHTLSLTSSLVNDGLNGTGVSDCYAGSAEMSSWVKLEINGIHKIGTVRILNRVVRGK